MKNRLLALVAACAVAVGLSLVGATPAQAALYNTVSNSYLSNSNVLVCGGPSGCVTLQPSYFTPGSPAWNPTQVAIGANTSALYRVRKGDWLGPWGGIEGGASGTWLNVGNLQAYFGSPINVEVLYNDPR